MTSTEDMQRTPRQHRDAIREQLAKMPANPDHNGHHDQDRAADAEVVARATAPVADPEPPAQGGMRPNPAQGSSGAAVPAPAPTNVRDAIRAQAAKINN